MKILNILGKVGAAAAAVAGLVLAGKTGFGENLLSGKDTDDTLPTDDLTQMPEVPEETTTEVVEEVQEEETPE